MGGGGGGMNTSMTPMSKPGMGGMAGGYSGAADMSANGLSPSQNQVRVRTVLCDWGVKWLSG